MAAAIPTIIQALANVAIMGAIAAADMHQNINGAHAQWFGDVQAGNSMLVGERGEIITMGGNGHVTLTTN